MQQSGVNIDPSWKQVLVEEFSKPYFAKIKDHIVSEKSKGINVFPPGKLMFNAFDTTPFDKVKIVILGQDPYHNPGEAMGLCFSVPKGIKVPPSLRNIYKEIGSDLGSSIPTHGDLTSWADQGVFLLNAMLSVSEKKPASHSRIGWQLFTDEVISTISRQKSGVVFMLWGNFAKAKSILIDENKHLVLKSAHPSPLAGGAFFNNHHFSKANKYLVDQGQDPIDWQII